ncbi:MAG: hypothetical protein LC789_14535 [Actinobacteria bacterium]|nr:hypothetical protein [Actinomycetota bacterium]MCA1721324.1 hypothetical protein [Actinomycetota bacterium]
MVVLTGTVDEDLRIDGEPTEVTYVLELDPAAAALVADGLVRQHPGVRLYGACGNVGPVDGAVEEVLEVGTCWATGGAELIVTIRQSNRPDPFARLVVEACEPEQAAAAKTLLASALGEARRRGDADR